MGSEVVALYESEAFCRALNETIVWCSRHALTGKTEDHRGRLALLSEAGRLRSLAYRAEQYWFAGKILAGIYSFRANRVEAMVDLNLVRGLEAQLRSSDLQPSSLAETHKKEERREIVRRVVEKRRALSQSDRRESQVPRNDGRLLLYFPVENLADGAAQVASNGFFDVDNIPPWDTWVHYSDRTLVSWVPQILIPLAQAGIDVNPEECIRWSD
jgi:hypothetical protein